MGGIFKCQVICGVLLALLVLHEASAQQSTKRLLLDFASSVHKCNPSALPSWTSTAALSQFSGVTVSSTGFITGLSLTDSNLCGLLPSSWAALTLLQTLSLSSNPNLTGPLPRAWSTLQALTELDLSFNPGLAGPLPPVWSALKALAQLYLPYNPGLVGPLPREWSVLTGLQAIDLSFNPSLTGTLPPAWSALLGLMDLDLSSNPGLAGPLPPVWSALKALQTLRLYSNPSLRGPLPPEWSALSELTELDLHSNPGLAGPLPPAWSALAYLADLSLHSNPGLAGPLPPAWSALSVLSGLELHSNPGLAGWLPPTWSALSALAELDLHSNPGLTGPLPLAWSKLLSLTALRLQSNPGLAGPLPPVWSALVSLADLYLQSNPGLTGPLPPAWSALAALQNLRLRSNRGLTGQLPMEWSALSSLRTLDLSRIPALHGELPGWMGNLSKLKTLNLSSCSLDGTLPSSLSNLANLRHLSLSRNSLNGPLPAAWSALTVLRSLDVSHNNCSGTLPASWSALQSWSVVKLAGNKLNGSLVDWSKKASWWNASVYVDVSDNQLSGQLPEFPTSIKFFNASANELSGTLPAIPPLLVYLHLGRNNLSGPMPDVLNSKLVFLDASWNSLSVLPQLFQAPDATYMNLAGNQLHGTLPEGYNHNLAYCDLSSNKLLGSIPASWHGRTWQYLALDGNLLSGTLSPWTGNVTVLLLQKNHLNGSLPEHWPGANTSRVMSFASNGISALPASWSMSFQKLLLLDVTDTKVKSVPLSWMGLSAFGGNQTVLRLGSLWKSSSNQRAWRQAVCIQPDLNSELTTSLQDFTLPDEVHTQVQDEVNRALAGLTNTLQELNVTDVTFDIGELQLRQGNVANVTLYQICGNPKAVIIVSVQWAFVCFAILCLVVLYSLEARWCLLSRIINYLGQPYHLRLNLQQYNKHAGTLGRLSTAKYVISLFVYWYDVTTDIVLIVHIWPLEKWPRSVLLGVLMLHYVVTVALMSWKLHLPLFYRVLWLVIGVPLMPVLDTLACVYLGMAGNVQQQVPSWCVFGDLQGVQWTALFEMREVLEVFLEAVPTAVLLSVVFLVGNTPEIGLYLENGLYILTAVGSCAQILRLVILVLWDSLLSGKSPWMTVWCKLSLQTQPERSSGRSGDVGDSAMPSEHDNAVQTGPHSKTKPSTASSTAPQVAQSKDSEIALIGMHEL